MGSMCSVHVLAEIQTSGLRMHALDWTITIGAILLVALFALYTHRFIKGVADFMAGGRCAGRYLICNARSEASSGVPSMTGAFEKLLVAGFTLSWWESILLPVLLFVGATGFVIYRYRETRALTLGQFFEMRYSRRFRLFAGALAFCAGICNYGIFPAISANFFVYFLGLPVAVSVFGHMLPTYVLVAAVYLSCALGLAMLGGQITLTVSDCIGGLFTHLVYLVIIVTLLWIIQWPAIGEVLASNPPGYSLINPFDQWRTPDFNLWFVAIFLALNIYNSISWQSQHGFNSAARTPHEGRMGMILVNWRTYAKTVMLIMLVICAMTYIRHPMYRAQAAPVFESVSQLDGKDAPASPAPIGSVAWLNDDRVPRIQKQMLTPITLSFMLPTGIKGLFCAILIMGLMADDAGHLHSWGSIFIQDVIMPLRRKSIPPRQHVRLLRLSLAGVAAWAFMFSLLFSQRVPILFWWQITQSIFCAGVGIAIIGGLYWKKGTNAAAWGATIVGALVSGGGILLLYCWPSFVALCHNMGFVASASPLPEEFPLNFMWVSLLAAAISTIVYVLLSIATSKSDFDLDAMLHRSNVSAERARVKQSLLMRTARLLGIDENFTFWDKLVTAMLFMWSIAWLLITVGGSVWNSIAPWPTEWWLDYWMIAGIGIPIGVATITFVWFGIGSVFDLRDFFDTLRTTKRNLLDDGSVDVQKPTKGLRTDEPPKMDGESVLSKDYCPRA
ncbi:MAG TPA: sodium:proline symporter [Phycisphaerae bacterium]|nr:sodium:proline symporter [Phycisphaerae bacterium]